MDAGQRGAGSLGAAVAFLTAVRVLSVGAGFLTSVIGARLIGADGLGLAGAALTLATIAALLANGGLNIATVYLLGREPDRGREIVGHAVAVGAVAIVLAAVLAAILALVVDAPVLGGGAAAILAPTLGLAAGILAFELAGGVLLGLRARSGYIGIQVVEAIGSLALTAVILWLLTRSAGGFLAAAALGYWAGAVVALWIAARRLGGIPVAFSGSFTRAALAFGLRGQVGNILQFLNLRLDQLLVPALLNLTSAGIYLVAVRVSEVITQVSSAAAAFLFPEVAAQAELRATDVTERTTRLTLLVVVAGGVPLALLAEPILRIAFGPDFASGANTIRIMLVAMLPLSIVRLLAGDLKGRGRPGIVSLAALVAVTMTVAADLALIPALGIEGAALASLVAYTVSAIVLLGAYLRLTDGSLGALVPRFADVRLLASAAARAWRGRRGGAAS
jgi:O-antigen/teichoic acid export membrane protein